MSKFYLFLLSSTFLISTAVHAKVIERIVAIVNSEIITLSDISDFKDKLKKGGLVDDALLKIVDIKQLKKDDKSIIEYLIDEKIIDSQIKSNGLEVTIERVEKEIRSIAQKNGIDREQLKKALKSQGVDFSQYQDFIKTTLERQGLIEKEITSKIKISDDEILEYFLKHSQQDINDDYYEYTLSHILFVGGNSGAEKAQQRAESVLEKLNASGDFSALASQYSEDPNFTQGGKLGTFKANEMNKELLASVAKLSIGGHTKVLNVGRGNFQIIRLEKKHVIPNPLLDAQKPRISGILFEAAFKKQLKNWLEKKRHESFVKINI